MNSFTYEEIAAAFRYEGGKLYWRIRPSKAVKVGDLAGSLTDEGYVTVTYRGRTMRAHRLVWLLCTGAWPTLGLDHRNLDRADNRFENLRPATCAQNGMNRGPEGDREFRGVTLHKQTGKYQTRLADRYIGLFATEQEAADAFDAKAVAIYGEFALTNAMLRARRVAATGSSS